MSVKRRPRMDVQLNLSIILMVTSIGYIAAEELHNAWSSLLTAAPLARLVYAAPVERPIHVAVIPIPAVAILYVAETHAADQSVVRKIFPVKLAVSSE